LLLPECLEDYAGPQHPGGSLEVFVEGLDLKACGFARTRQRPAGHHFAPGDLLKLYLWSG
jgi:hypothetical protein